jgi:hypothetical protein
MRSFGAAAQRVNRSLELVVIVFIRVNIGDKQVKIIICLENIGGAQVRERSSRSNNNFRFFITFQVEPCQGRFLDGCGVSLSPKRRLILRLFSRDLQHTPNVKRRSDFSQKVGSRFASHLLRPFHRHLTASRRQ